MLYRENFDGITEIVKADAVITDTKTELGRVDTLQAFHIAFSRSQKARQRVENAESRGLIDGAEIGPGLAESDDLLRHWLLV